MYAALVLGESPVAGAAAPRRQTIRARRSSRRRASSRRASSASARVRSCATSMASSACSAMRGRSRPSCGVRPPIAASIARVAVAATRGAALLLAHARPGLTDRRAGAQKPPRWRRSPIRALDAVSGCDVPPRRCSSPPHRPRGSIARRRCRTSRAHTAGSGRAASAGAAEARARYESMMETFARWGVRTLGDLAALPPAQLSARLGQPGVRLQRLARGEDTGPLVPLVPEETFEAHLDLEWPIEGLEPLSFVLGRLLEPVCAHLERRGRAAAVLTTRLRLVSRETHVRSLQLPAAMRDPRVLRTLALLDLESHPPGAGHRRGYGARRADARARAAVLAARARAARARAAVHARRTVVGAHGTGPLRLRAHPRHASPRRVRDGAVRGGARAARLSTHLDARRHPAASRDGAGAAAWRSRRRCAAFATRCRFACSCDESRPARVTADRTGIPAGRVEMAAGPWRSSGDWWAVTTDASVAGRRPCVATRTGRRRRRCTPGRCAAGR